MATIDSLIAAKRAKIASRVASESDLTDEIIKDLAQLKQAGLTADGSAPTVVDSASIGSGIDSSADIDAIKALLNNILGELVNSKAFADIVVQDTAKMPFIRREEVDQTTGQRTIRIENFDGSLGAPVGTIVPIKNGGDSILEDQYYAKAAGPGFSSGDSLSSLRVVDETRAVTLLGWFNITTQSVIAAPPTAAIKGYEDLIEELLSKLVSQLPASLGQKTAAQSLAVALASDTALPLPLGAATALNQEEEILALEAIGTSTARAATEATLLTVRDKLTAIEANTLVPNFRPLTPAVDAVRVESATLATVAKQDEQKTVLTAIDQKLALASTAGLQSVAIDKLDQILVELSKAKEFEDLIVQDTEGTTFVRREVLNESNNQRTITIENFDGTTGAPVGAVTTVKQIKSNSIVTRNYYAKVAGAGFAAGDSLATMQIVNGETTAVTLLGWFNITTQLSIAAPDTAAISGYEDVIQELLAQIVGSLPASLGAKLSAESLAVVLALDTVLPLPAGAATENGLTALLETIGVLNDISFPAADGDEATVKGLLRITAKRVLDITAEQIATIGDAAETDVAGSPNDFGSLKAILRGFWQDTDLSSVQNTLESILTNVLQSNIRPLLPSDTVTIAALPNSIEADIAAIRANTANISRYQFSLAQTTAGVVFLVRTDGVTGTSININIDTGLAFAPGSRELSDPIAPSTGGTKVIEPNEFVAKTTVAGKWTVEDILTRVTIVDTSNNTISGTIWQDAAGNLLTTIPVLGVDVEDTNRTQLALIKAQPTAGTPIVAEALPTGSGTYGWLSYIRSTLAGMAGNLASIITNTATPNIRSLTAATDTVTVVLPSTAATTSNQATGNATLISMLGRTPTLGQKTGIGSSPVVLASDVVIPTVISDATGAAAAIKAGNTPSANTDNALTVITRPDSTTIVSALPGTIQADITAIKNNTARISQFQFQLVEDALGTVFVARYDTVTGVVTNLTLGGSNYTPSGALDVVASGGGGKAIEPNEYQTKTTNSTNWTIGDILTRVLIVDTIANTVTGTIWQKADGTILSVIPVLGVDVDDTDKAQLAALQSLQTNIGTYNDLAAITDTGSATLFSLMKRLLAKLQTGSQPLVNTIATSNTRQVTTSLVVTGANNNVLDPTGAGNSTDVTNYNSCRIVITTGANSFAYQLNSDLVATNWIDSSGVQVGAIGTIAPGQTVSFTVNLTNLSFLRLLQTSNNNGIVVAITMSQAFDSQRVVAALNPAQNLGAVASVGAILDSTTTNVVIGGTGGVITLNNLSGRNTATFAITGSWLGTLQVQVSLNGIDWSTIATNHIQNLLTKAFQSNQITANGIYQTQITGFSYVRLIAISWVTGNASTIARASIANLSVAIEGRIDPNATSVSQISDAATVSSVLVLGASSSALILNGRGVATFGIGGTWSGTLQAQLSANGVDWYNITINNAVYDLKNKGFNNNGSITANGLYQINVGGLGQVRLIATAWTSGTATITGRASNASSLVAIEGSVNAQISNTNLLTRSDSNSTSSDLNSTITTTASSITFNQTWGVSRAAEINVTAIAAGTTYTVEWQEPVGAGWRTVYRFAPITATGAYRSPLLPNTNGSWRYLETIGGATPSVTRSITRTQSNLVVAQAIVPTRTGGFNLFNTGFDLPLYGRTRRIVATNRTATLYFLQVHDKASALVVGDVPLAAEVYQLPGNATLPFTVADLGPEGTLFGVNPRLALSTTFNTYTPLSSVVANTISLFVESI